MAGQALYRKWRSQAFETVIGQEHVTLTLRNALRDGRLTHAYLFTGPRGTGKTSTARIVAKAINCLAEDVEKRPCNECSICRQISEGRLLDLIEIDAASNRGIDEIRDLREKIAFRPNEARYKVYIIDEVHMLTKEAFNALLKTLEEPPAHAVFVLATTEPDRVPETVRSRCQRFDFRRISTNDIVKHLNDLVEREGRKADAAALAAIARRSTGSMRDSISLLDQLLSYGDEVLTLERVEGVLGLVNQMTIGKLVDHMAGGESGPGLMLLNELVTEGVELGQLTDQVIAYLRAVMVARIAGSTDALDLPQETRKEIARQAARMEQPLLLQALKEWTEARGMLRDQVPGAPQLPLELALLRSAALFTQQGMAAAVSAQPPVVVEAPARQQVERDRAPAQVQPQAQVQQPAKAPPAKVAPPAQAEAGSRQPEVVQRPAQGAPPQGAPPEGAAAGPGEELQQRVNANWDRFMATARTQCGVKIHAALKSVKAVVVSGRTLELQFAPMYGFACEMIGEPAAKAQVENSWRQVLGEPVAIRCVVLSAAAAAKGDKGEATEGSAAGHGADALLEDAKRRGAVIKQLD